MSKKFMENSYCNFMLEIYNDNAVGRYRISRSLRKRKGTVDIARTKIVGVWVLFNIEHGYVTLSEGNCFIYS